MISSVLNTDITITAAILDPIQCVLPSRRRTDCSPVPSSDVTWETDPLTPINMNDGVFLETPLQARGYSPGPGFGFLVFVLIPYPWA